MNKDESLKLEHSTLLQEFSTVRENMLFDLGLARQVVNISLTAAGILVAGTPYIIQSNLPVLFLIAPLVFYPLAWTQIRYLFITSVLSQYLMTVLTPRIQKVMQEISPDKDRNFDSIMSWEAFLGAADRRHSLILLPVAGANYGINLIVIVFSIGAYFAIVYGQTKSIQIWDWILLALNGILFLYSILLGYWSRFRDLDLSRQAEEILGRKRQRK